MTRRETSRLLIFLATIAFVSIGTFLMIRYAKGYRPTRDGTLRGTGLLAANSFPTGAEVYINDRISTATDNTLNLDPGEYDISIRKDGYYNWAKKLVIKEELVTQTNATLFPTSPTLQPLTFTGSLNPIPAPDGNKLVFAVASASATVKNGLYVQDLASTPITLNRAARQIARTAPGYDYTRASYTWSPNGSQILVSFAGDSHILLESDRFNDLAALTDVTVRLPQIFQEWEEELARQERTRLAKLPDFMVQVATASAANLYLSPDGEKLLYQAKADLTIPTGLIPELPASSTQAETRDLQVGSWYVYDLKEDKNFLVAIDASPSPSPSKPSTPAAPAFSPSRLLLLDNIKDLPPVEMGSSPSAFKRLQQGVSVPQTIALFNAQYAPLQVTQVQWFPDSYHLILTSNQGIDVVEYDNTNRTTIYGGPFDPGFVYPWPDGSKIITRIQFSPDTIPNLYTINLK